MGQKIRDGKSDWTNFEAYVAGRTDAEFTHGICPDCLAKNLGAGRKQPTRASAGQPRATLPPPACRGATRPSVGGTLQAS